MRRLTFLLLLPLFACTQGEQANEAAPANALTAATPIAENAISPVDSVRAANDLQWTTRETEEGLSADYGPSGSAASFSISCEQASQRIHFTTTEVPQSGPGPTKMLLSGNGVEQTIIAETSADGLPRTSAAVPASAPWLDTLFSKPGELRARIGEGEPIIVPITPSLRDLVTACAPRAA